jgi:hypothetical protein
MDYNRDRYGRKLPRRTRDKHCDDCGQNGMPARTIQFPGGMLYDVCAIHESEYCGTPAERRATDEGAGHGAVVVPVGGWNAQPVIYGYDR